MQKNEALQQEEGKVKYARNIKNYTVSLSAPCLLSSGYRSSVPSLQHPPPHSHGLGYDQLQYGLSEFEHSLSNQLPQFWLLNCQHNC